jgi:hypothetical protein
MTKLDGGASAVGDHGSRCGWCQRTIVRRPGPGRPRRYCRQTCRQQAYLARRLAEAHGLGDDRLIVERSRLETAQDRIALLGQALADLDREQAGGELADPAQAYAWLRIHAAEVAALRLEPAWLGLRDAG